MFDPSEFSASDEIFEDRGPSFEELQEISEEEISASLAFLDESPEDEEPNPYHGTGEPEDEEEPEDFEDEDEEDFEDEEDEDDYFDEEDEDIEEEDPFGDGMD